MLHLVRGLYDEWTRTEPYRVVVVGRAGAGKSGLVSGLSRAVAGRPGLPIASLRPTLGQTVVEVPLPLPLPPPLTEQVRVASAAAAARRAWLATSKRYGRLKLWDLGASSDLPTLWPRYYPDADCVVFVVDAAVFAHLLPAPGAPSALSEAGPDAQDAWTQLASILSDLSLREKPVLIAISKVDTLLDGPDPPPDAQDGTDGTQLQPTSQGSALDLFEESVRTWFAHRFASAAAGQQAPPGAASTADRAEHRAAEPPAQPPEASSRLDQATAAQDSPQNARAAAPPPAAPPAGPPAEASSAAQAPPGHASPAPHGPSSENEREKRTGSLISERYWEVVCVSAVSLVGLADFACCLQLLAQQAE